MDKIEERVENLEKRLKSLETIDSQNQPLAKNSRLKTVLLFSTILVSTMMLGASGRSAIEIQHTWTIYNSDNTQIWQQKEQVGALLLKNQYQSILVLSVCGALLFMYSCILGKHIPTLNKFIYLNMLFGIVSGYLLCT